MSAVANEDTVLRTIVEGVEAETGERFFASLVRHLAAALGVQYAFVSELSEDRSTFRTRALWGRGVLLDNFTSPLVGTPCEAVLKGQMAAHRDSIQTRFPDDVGLVAWGVESYCGVPLLDSGGMVLGHLAIFDDKPMQDESRGLAIMRIFAARARAEVERVHAEAALRENETRYRDLYEEAPIMYLSIGVDSRIQRANHYASRLLGYTLDHLIGHQVFDFLADSPAGKPRARAILDRFRAGEETLNSEVEWRRADGTPLWTRASVRPIIDAQGNVLATRSTHVDITDRKLAEETLRDSEERVARILDSAMDAIVTFDADRRIELFNHAAEAVFACPAINAIGHSLDRFLTDDFRQALQTAMHDLVTGGDRSKYSWVPHGLRARSANAHEFAIEATLSLAEVRGRRLYTLILRSVEERQRAEKELGQLHLDTAYLAEEIKSVHNFEEIVGQSHALRQTLEQVRLVAATDAAVLILGETGTGKELVARAVHSQSQRKGRPLIKVNCAALPPSLIESELFGHEKGAFTGATEKRLGRFELAHGGTIFLDELGEMPADVQVKLLRVLQEREFERVGGTKTITVDVRVIAATNRDLHKAIDEGKFRQDLYYRLNVFPVRLPALRERREDIPLLVHYFAARYATKIGRPISRVSKEVMQRLTSYSWPGNVRELENVIERGVILSSGVELKIGVELLPRSAVDPRPQVQPAPLPSDPPPMPVASSLEQNERNHLLATLKQTNWRIEGADGAARLLNINPSTLRSRIKKLGIRRDTAEVS